MVGIIVVWKRKENEQQHTKQESVYYTTIDETIQRSPTNKPEPVYSKMNDGQDSKEPQYMGIPEDICSSKPPDKVTMQDNPAYSVHEVNTQDNLSHSVTYESPLEMQDNPAYSTATSAITQTVAS